MKNNTIIVTDAEGKEVARGTVPAVDGANTRLQVSEFMRERVSAWFPGKPFPDIELEFAGEMRSEDGEQLAVVKSCNRSYYYSK